MRSDVLTSTNDIIHQKQYSRRNDVGIKGISLRTNRDNAEVVIALENRVLTFFTIPDFDDMHRVPTKVKAKPNILVKLF